MTEPYIKCELFSEKTALELAIFFGAESQAAKYLVLLAEHRARGEDVALYCGDGQFVVAPRVPPGSVVSFKRLYTQERHNPNAEREEPDEESDHESE